MSSFFQNGTILLLILLFQTIPWSRCGPSIFLTIALQSLVHKLYTKAIQVNKEDEIRCTVHATHVQKCAQNFDV